MTAYTSGCCSAKRIALRLDCSVVPIAIILETPASFARPRTASRSVAKSGKSRWACVSTSITEMERRSARLPLDNGTRPGQTAAKHDEKDVVADFESTGSMRLVERDGDCRRRRIPVFLQIHIKLLDRQAHPMSDCLDDSHVCLMRDDTGNIFVFQVCRFQSTVRGVGHSGHGLFVGFLTLHLDRVELLSDVFQGDRVTAPAARHEE